MTKPKRLGTSSPDAIALLARYKCPTPFQEARNSFLGSIASPVLGVSPLEVVKQLWGGELPEFDTEEDVNELLHKLVAGLWNVLTVHQSRRSPFRLLRFEVAPTREGVRHFALVRRQELDGFIEGLFGPNEHLDLPERAHKAVGVLGEVRATLAGTVDLLEDLSKPAESGELKGLIQNLQQIASIAETEINKAVLSCTLARRHALQQMPATKPTLH